MKQRLKYYRRGDICPACGRSTTYNRDVCGNLLPCQFHYGLKDFHMLRECTHCEAEWLENGANADYNEGVNDIAAWDGIPPTYGFWKRLGNAIIKVIESWARSPKLIPVTQEEYERRVKNGE